jgi:hypothetical protein
VARKVQKIQRSNRKRSRPKVSLTETLAAETANAKTGNKIFNSIKCNQYSKSISNTKNSSIPNPQTPCSPPHHPADKILHPTWARQMLQSRKGRKARTLLDIEAIQLKIEK